MSTVIRSIAKICAVIALSMIGALPCEAQRRVALVIGNGAYENTARLANPRNDAEDIADELQRLGFEVVVGLDLNKSSMDRTISKFAASLPGSEMALFFYAGHGLQVGGQNYLVPLDAKLTTSVALDFEMVRLGLVQQAMEAATSTNIIILDACRDNPLGRNLARALGTRSAVVDKGLAAAEAGYGTLISYSTQPGNVALDGKGRNSPFTAALLRHLSRAGEDISTTLINVRRDVMLATDRQQVPWEHSALTSRVFLVPNTQGTPADAATDGSASSPSVALAQPAVPVRRGPFDGRWQISWSAPNCFNRRGSFWMDVNDGIVSHGKGRVSASGSAKWTAPATGGNTLTDWTGSFEGTSASGRFVRRDGKCAGSFTARRR